MGLVVHSMWNLLRLGIELMSPAQAGRFFSTVPPGTSLPWILEFLGSLTPTPSREEKIPSVHPIYESCSYLIHEWAIETELMWKKGTFTSDGESHITASLNLQVVI